MIKLLLVAAIRAEATIPTDLADRLMLWARTYVGHSDHPALCSLVARAISTGRPAIDHERLLGMCSAAQAETQANQ